MSLLKQLFTWWDGQTIGTRLWTSRNGEKVGEDEQGNIYYRSLKNNKRWVIFSGAIEASNIPPEWHGWLHHTFPEPPTDAPFVHKKWEKPNRPNMTGSVAAYHPTGSQYSQSSGSDSDYQAWVPE